MHDYEGKENSSFADPPWFIVPLLVEPVEEEDDGGVDYGDGDRILNSEEFIIQSRIDVEWPRKSEIGERRSKGFRLRRRWKPEQRGRREGYLYAWSIRGGRSGEGHIGRLSGELA